MDAAALSRIQLAVDWTTGLLLTRFFVMQLNKKLWTMGGRFEEKILRRFYRKEIVSMEKQKSFYLVARRYELVRSYFHRW